MCFLDGVTLRAKRGPKGLIWKIHLAIVGVLLLISSAATLTGGFPTCDSSDGEKALQNAFEKNASSNLATLKYLGIKDVTEVSFDEEGAAVPRDSPAQFRKRAYYPSLICERSKTPCRGKGRIARRAANFFSISDTAKGMGRIGLTSNQARPVSSHADTCGNGSPSSVVVQVTP